LLRDTPSLFLTYNKVFAAIGFFYLAFWKKSISHIYEEALNGQK